MRSLACLALLLALGGCAVGPELRAFRATTDLVDLQAVPFFAQSAHQCGPAALATVLAASGVDAPPDQLVDQMFLPGRAGSLQAELISSARQQGRVPLRLPGHLAPMLEELRAGRPLLVLQNLGIDAWPRWHYAVLVGFDASRDEFLLRSGGTRRQAMSGRDFLASWDRGGRWALVVTPAGEPPVSATALAWLQAVAPLESTGALELAAQGYAAAVARWPAEPLAWTALGNARYGQGRLDEATAAYREALARDPQAWAARNNLVQALLDQHCALQARHWIDAAGPAPAEIAARWQQTRLRPVELSGPACAAAVAP